MQRCWAHPANATEVEWLNFAPWIYMSANEQQTSQHLPYSLTNLQILFHWDDPWCAPAIAFQSATLTVLLYNPNRFLSKCFQVLVPLILCRLPGAKKLKHPALLAHLDFTNRFLVSDGPQRRSDDKPTVQNTSLKHSIVFWGVNVINILISIFLGEEHVIWCFSPIVWRCHSAMAFSCVHSLTMHGEKQWQTRTCESNVC